MIPWIIVIVALVLIDQVSKLMVSNLMDYKECIPLIDGVLNLRYELNPGIAMGMLSELPPSLRWVIIVIPIAAIAAMLVYLWKFRPNSIWACLGISMIAAGGIGNLIDRIFYGEELFFGQVIDFIDFCAFPTVWKYVFNFADACVCVGGAIVMLWLICSIISDEKKERAKKKLAAEAATEAPAEAPTEATEVVEESTDEATEAPKEEADEDTAAE